MGTAHHFITVHGLERARDLANTKLERQELEIAAAVFADEGESLGICHAGFALTSLPHKKGTVALTQTATRGWVSGGFTDAFRCSADLTTTNGLPPKVGFIRRGAAGHASRIYRRNWRLWKRANNAFLDVGRHMIDAKARPKHGEFGKIRQLQSDDQADANSDGTTFLHQRH